jgi:carbamoyltransferase
VRILGISGLYHDSAAALVKDGVIVAAAEEERFSRKKGDASFPKRAIDFCLQMEGVRAEDLDFVVFYEKPFEKFDRLLSTLVDSIPRSFRVFRSSMLSWFRDKLWIRAQICERLGVRREKVLFSEHHLSHAASAFFCSPFDDAAVMTMDGVGEWSTGTLGKATGREGGPCSVDLLLETRFPHSLGMLYSAFTAFLGFEVNEGEYKVMGMAPYGKPRYVEEILRMMDLRDDGSFRLDLSYFSYHTHAGRAFGSKFEELFGPPRPPGRRFVTRSAPLSDDPEPASTRELEENEKYADIAASIQEVTEQILLNSARHLHRQTGARNLCIAGGVGLNSVANTRLLAETPFEDVYIQPAAGDAGGAIGAALYVYHVVLGKPRGASMGHAYHGRSYGDAEIARALDASGLAYERLDEERLLDRTVGLLTEGKVIGWFQGRFEWGPRALGNRSILADARDARMKDVVNLKIKFREPFRPFAPSVPAERAASYFELPKKGSGYPLRFMLMVTPVREEKRAAIPATTHVDGTARLQAVHAETNPLYHRLLSRFEQATGVPVVLNTSFNLKGEPIVAGPEDAISTYQRCGLDALVLGGYLTVKA